MKKTFIHTGALVLTLVLGAAVSMPSAATAVQQTTVQGMSVVNTGHVLFDGCERITHENFCYCTGCHVI
jgi:hypothetical protein